MSHTEEPHGIDNDATAATVVVVVTGGEPLPESVAGQVPPGAFVIAADSGVDEAARLGLVVDLAVGDFDSVSPEGLRAAVAAGAEVQRHPAAKDATDLELALDAAVARGAREIIVVGGHGGRLDHQLGGLLVLCRDAYADVRVRAFTGTAWVHVVRSRAVLAGAPGDVVTLLPIGGPARGVTTEGLEYALSGETLWSGSTRGVSNVMTAPGATVTVEEGVLIAVVPVVPAVSPTTSP